MNTSIELLFHLDIPIDFINKLNNYYYIPENKIKQLRLGGYIYLVDKYISNKKLNYLGILTKINDNIYIKNKDSISIDEILNKYHLFYKPKINKMSKAIQMINLISN